jgi:CO/xanthine dehydrogenase Mo-binding subunit
MSAHGWSACPAANDDGVTDTTEILRERTWRERFAEPDRRVDGEAKVSGQAKYTADVTLPGMLWAAFANSPFPHARIVSIDVAEAKRVPGVRAIITGLDLGPLRFGRKLFDRPVLAYDVVRFVGDRVAAVAADTKEAAEEAARLIDVTYEELPGVYTTHDALAPDAPVIHAHADEYLFQNDTRPPRAHPNIQGGITHVKGDADLEPHFAAAYRVFEHRFTTPRQHCGYLEPHATIVHVDDAGIVHVYSPCKAPFRLRGQLSIVTGVPAEQIVVERMAIGGDFGGKGIVIDEFPVYFLAKATGRPVKYVSTYVDDMRAMSVRHAATVVLRTGVDRDGTLLVHEAHVDYDGGAYAAGKPGGALTPGQLGFATIGYRVPHVRLEVRSVYTNTVPASHMRAPADVQTVFAWEQHMDMIADDLGIDPFDLRLRNVMVDGDTALTGENMHHPRGRDVLDVLRRESRWDESRAKRNRGRGIGFTCRHTGGGKTKLTLRLHADGALEVITGVPDQGSGSATVITRVIGATMSVDTARIRIRHENTAEALNDPGAGASRVTHIVGGAAYDAGVAMRALLDEKLGLRLSEDRFVDDATGRAIAFEEGAADACEDGPIEVVGAFDGSHSDPAHPADYSFSAYVVDVDVDAETGAFRLADATFVVDVGTIINPVSHQGQIDGGFVYGWGNAVLEEMPIDESGRCPTLNLADYKLPSIADLPPLRTILLEPVDAGGPFGAKMAGELSNSPLAPAIANAIARAVGARVTHMPITAERVYQHLHGNV